MTLALRYTLVLLVAAFFSCTKDSGKVNRGNYPDDVGTIITTKCATAGCHNSKSYSAAGGYNLESWESMFSGASSGSPVIPFNSRFSSLCYYINTYADLGLQNTPTMPLNGQPLSHEEVTVIKNWIDAGAPDVNGNVKWADNPKRKKLYAVNQGCDVVTVFDSETQLPIRFIQVGTKASGNTPHQLRISPDGNYWYVIFVNNNIMQKYSCVDDRLIGNIPLSPLAAGTGIDDAQDWNTFVISKDGKRAYCVSWTASGKVVAVDLEKMKLLHYLGGQIFPHGIVLSESEDKMYVGGQGGNYLTEIDTGFTFTNLLPLENNVAPNNLGTVEPHDIILSPDGKNLVVTCQKSNDLRIYNLLSGSVTNIIPTGYYPQEVIYSKLTDQYFVSCTEDTTSFPGTHGTIMRINANGYGNSRIACGFQPHGIAIDENKKLLYVLSRNVISDGPAPHHTSQCAGRNGFVSYIDLATFKVLPKRYELSVDPYFIYARP